MCLKRAAFKISSSVQVAYYSFESGVLERTLAETELGGADRIAEGRLAEGAEQGTSQPDTATSAGGHGVDAQGTPLHGRKLAEQHAADSASGAPRQHGADSAASVSPQQRTEHARAQPNHPNKSAQEPLESAPDSNAPRPRTRYDQALYDILSGGVLTIHVRQFAPSVR